MCFSDLHARLPRQIHARIYEPIHARILLGSMRIANEQEWQLTSVKSVRFTNDSVQCHIFVYSRCCTQASRHSCRTSDITAKYPPLPVVLALRATSRSPSPSEVVGLYRQRVHTLLIQQHKRCNSCCSTNCCVSEWHIRASQAS